VICTTVSLEGLCCNVTAQSDVKHPVIAEARPAADVITRMTAP
jgi:hypothetical protein